MRLVLFLALAALAAGQAADVGVSKSGPDQMIIGFPQPYRYQINIANAGPNSSMAVVMTDPVPARFNIVSVTSSYSNGTIFCRPTVNNLVDCEVVNLRAGDVARVFVNVTIPANTQAFTARNTAFVTASTFDPDLSNNNNTRINPVISSADLSVDIQGPGDATAGQRDAICSTSRTVNLGFSDATDVTSRFKVVSGLLFGSVEITEGDNVTGRCEWRPAISEVVCEFPRLANQEAFAYRVCQFVPASTLLPAGGELVFWSYSSALTFDPDLNNNNDTHSVRVTVESDVSVTKGSLQKVVAGQGETTLYTIVVENAGPSNALGVVMTDELPFPFGNILSWDIVCNITPNKKRIRSAADLQGLSLREGVPCGRPLNCTRPRNDNFLRCDIDQLNLPERIFITVTVDIAANAYPPNGVFPWEVTNTAFVSSETADNNQDRNRDSAVTEVCLDSDVAVNKTGFMGSIISGDGNTYEYTIRTTNLGISRAYGVTMNDTVPAPMVVSGDPVVRQGDGSCSRVGNFIQCNFGNMDVGASTEVTVPFQVPANAATLGNIINTAFIQVFQNDTNPANNQDSHSNLVLAAPDVAVNKTGPARLEVGPPTVYEYTIVVNNAGPSDALNGRLEDVVPDAFVVQDPIRTSKGSCGRTGNSIVCDLGALPFPTEVTVFVPFTIRPGTTAVNVSNTAFVFHTTPDRDPSNNNSTQDTVLIRQADLRTIKSGPAQICAGEPERRFQVQVTNFGPTDAVAAQFVDELPLQFQPGTGPFTYAGNRSSATCAYEGRLLRCQLGNMANGDTVTVTYPVFVLPGTPAQTGVRNWANATSLTEDPVPTNNNSLKLTDICARADLSIGKTAAPTATAGSSQLLPYVLNVRNNGPAVAVNATVTDRVPSVFTPLEPIVVTGGAGSCSYDANDANLLRCTFDRLLVGETRTISFNFQVAANVPAGPYENCALISSATEDIVQSNNQACANTTVSVVSDLQILKAGPGVLCAGEAGDFFTLTVTNLGPSLATGVSVTDLLDTVFTPGAAGSITVSPQTGTGCTFNGQLLSCANLGSLAVNGQISIRYPVSVAANVPAQQDVANTGRVTSTSPDGDSNNNNSTHLTDICANANIVVTKEGDATATAGSGQYQYTISVTNNGLAFARDVFVTDDVPDVFTVQGTPSATGGGTCQLVGQPNTFRCTWPGAWAVGRTETVLIDFTVAANVASGNYQNCAEADNAVNDPSRPNIDCTTTRVDVAADLGILKEGPPVVCAGGDPNVFRLNVTNFGPAIANGVRVNDTLDAVFTPGPSSSITTTKGSCSYSGQLLQCDLGTLAVGESVQITYPFSVGAGVLARDDVPNTAFVSAVTGDGNTMNNQDTHLTDICNESDLAVTKAGPLSLVAGTGEVWQYTIAVTNNGPSTAINAFITDNIPAVFTPGPIDDVIVGGGGSCQYVAPNSLQCVWPEIAVDATFTVTIPFVAGSGVPAGDRTNCVDISLPANSDPNPNNNRACNTTMVQVQANLNIAKTGPANVCAGEGILREYVISVANPGPSDAQSVTVTDTIPEVLTFAGLDSVRITDQNQQPAAGSCNFFPPNVLSCSLGTIRNSIDLRNITFGFRVASSVQAQTVTNVATVSSPTPEIPGGGASDTATFTTEICAQADLSIQKTGPPSITAGTAAVQQFTLTVENVGLADAYDVTVSDNNIPLGQFAVTGVTSQNGGNCTLEVFGAVANIECFYPFFGVAETDTILIDFTVPASAVPRIEQNCAGVDSAVTEDPDPSNNNDCHPVTIIAQADLRTTKTGPAQVTAGVNGPQNTYTITVTNIGGSDAVNSSLEDEVPAGFVPQSATSSVGSCQPIGSDQIVRCNFGTLAPNASATVTIPFTVASNLDLASRLNTACAATDTNESTQENNCASFTTVVVCSAINTISKTDNVDEVIAGSAEILIYTIVIGNNGPSTSRSTTLTDTFPPEFEIAVEPSSSQGICTLTGTGFACNLLDIAAGSSVTVTVGYRVPANTLAVSASNEACVSNACGAQASVCAIDTNIISQRVDLVTIKDDCVDTVLAGEVAATTYTITVENKGPSDAIDFRITDRLPAVYDAGQIETSPPGADCIISGEGFECRWAVLPAGVTATVTIEYTVAADVPAQYATNCAVASSSTTELVMADNRDCDTNQIIAQADLEVTKEIDNADCVVAGSLDVRRYTVTVTNKGPSTAYDVEVFDIFPADLIASGPAECSVENGSNYTCRLGTLGLGDSVTLFWEFTVGSSRLPGLVENFVSVTSSTLDPELCNNNATVCSIICAQSDLAVTKDDGVTVVTAGDLVTYVYQITGTNFGPSDARQVSFVDTFPTAFNRTVINAPGAEVVITSTGFQVLLPLLAAGDTYTFNVSYVVPACELACQACNFVTIASPYEDPNEQNNQAQDCNELRTEANLEVCKDDGVTQVTAGDGITYEYTIQVANNGPSCAQKVKLVDHFPPEVFQIPGSIITSKGVCINVNGSDFSCNLLTLEPGEVVEVRVKYTVPSSANTCSVDNTVTVSSLTFDPELCNNDAKDVNALVEKAEVSLTKTDNTDAILSGDLNSRVYTIVVGNNGPSTARDVVVSDVWPAGFVQFLESLQVNKGHCVGTGTDFTCSVGDIAVGETAVIYVSYNLMQPPMCGLVRNKVSAFSPTDETCREAEDVTSVDCTSPTTACVNCAIAATETPGGGCYDLYESTCRGSSTACETCYASIKADPRNPSALCFSDATACAFASCLYNAGGPCSGPAGQGEGPCRSPDQVDITCPTPARRSVASMFHATVAKKEDSFHARKRYGKLLSPKLLQVEATQRQGMTYEVTLRNPMRRVVTVEELSVQLVSKTTGKTTSMSLASENAALVSQTTCRQTRGRELRSQWTTVCDVTFADLSDVAQIKISARGVSQLRDGYHPVMGTKLVTLEEKK